MASEYQLTATPTVIRTEDGAFIPDDPANRDRAKYEAWLEDGGVPDPYVAPPEPEPAPTTLAAHPVNDMDATTMGSVKFYVTRELEQRLEPFRERMNEVERWLAKRPGAG